MGVIEWVLSFVFGGGRNVLKETAEVFRENAEGAAQRAQDVQIAAMQGHAAEFRAQDRGRFDRVMDAVNRLPRPAMALGCLALFVSAMVDPVWFAARMSGIALVPEPLWWLLGVVVSFYFGARHQAKGQEFQRSMSDSLTRVSEVVDTLVALEGPIRSEARSPMEGGENPVLAEWRKHSSGGATK
ncbi:holin family protein [uncultured Shimia sp.]|uniref:holin family protein n=1 Tax=uncultured Shimia sp. TaxID=573152 RepID=UPI00261788AA|nr:holin family protein [uncultured Shimia sp.]